MCFGSGALVIAVYHHDKFRYGQFSQYGHSLVTSRTWSEMRESYVN